MRRLRLQRHRLRARRVRSWSGWQPGELDALLRPERADAAPPWQDHLAALIAREVAAGRTVVVMVPW